MKIVIIGGVAGGVSAATRARRLQEYATIIIFQSGSDVSYATCGMPYYIGGEITNRSSMSIQTPQSLHDRYNIDVRIHTCVTNIYTEKQMISVMNERTGDIYTETYDHLIIAVGSIPYKPHILGIDRPGLYTLRSLQDMDDIVQWISQVQSNTKYTTDATSNNKMHCVVVGAGFVGLEMVEQLLRKNIKITIVEMMKQILSPLDIEMAAIIQQNLEAHGVTVITNDSIQEFIPDPSDPNISSIITLSSGRQLPSAQMTILGLGVRPDTAIVKEAGIRCTERGHIIVDDYLHTSAPNVWAVGDAIEVNNPILQSNHKWTIPLAGPANRQGRMVADNIILKNPKKYTGTYGVSVVRSIDLYAACVGMNAKMLLEQNVPFKTVHIHPGSHAGYYPGASAIHLKLLFCPKSGKMYGAQAIGKDGVDKRIDVIATAIQGAMSVHELAELELCYAPPVGSAKDPVNYAGMVASNIVDGITSSVEWNDFNQLLTQVEDAIYILDVRNPDEIASTSPISDKAVNIPLNSLRNRIMEVPKDKKIVVSCVSGQRAYYACRILQQHGYFHTDYLDGAYLTFHAIHP